MKFIRTKHLVFIGAILFPCFVFSCKQSLKAKERIPVIYSTDLYHPPQDPDDHYDLAILSSLEELEIKALIFDVATSFRKPEEFGKIALDQMEKITGKSAPPWKVGLTQPLRSPDDKAYDQPEEFQAGVELILSTLKKSDVPVVMFMVGSCRDFAVAFNRDPDLLRQKVKAVYVNAGNGRKGTQDEWNVKLDANAYMRLMSSGLPIYWCPCIVDAEQLSTPEEVLEGKVLCTYFRVFNQAELLKTARPMVKNFFAYALNRSEEEPLDFLDKEPQPLPETRRNMWCTGPFLHAAGREIYRNKDNRWIARSPNNVQQYEVNSPAVEVFRFEPIHITAVWKDVNGNLVPEFRDAADTEPTSIQVFRYTHVDYNQIMTSVLADLFTFL